MPIIIETADEFDARHTTDAPKLSGTNCQLFADGAMRDSLGNHHEAPVEAGALLVAKRRYVALKLQLEEEAFEAFKASCKEMLAAKARYTNTLPGPAPDAKEQLEAGAARIKQIRSELAAMDRELAALPDERARRAFLEQQRANQQSVRSQLNDIIGVSI